MKHLKENGLFIFIVAVLVIAILSLGHYLFTDLIPKIKEQSGTVSLEKIIDKENGVACYYITEQWVGSGRRFSCVKIK